MKINYNVKERDMLMLILFTLNEFSRARLSI